jgi:hypothetical protein
MTGFGCFPSAEEHAPAGPLPRPRRFRRPAQPVTEETAAGERALRGG